MSVEGNRDGIDREDLYRFADRFRVPGYKAVVNEVLDAVRQWPDFANDAGMSADATARISADLASVHLG